MGKFRDKAKPFIYLLIILFLAYLPLSTFIFGMKNDAFSDNFPQKFFLSQCLHSGVSPLWNPYMNFGYPAYADMGFAFYNPIVWLFAAIGYNAYLLTAEVLLYMYIGGVAIYCLGRYFSFGKYIAIAVASMYMCSGFFVGAIQHINALAAAAFFPFALLFTLRLIRQPCYKNSFLLSVVLYMIFASGHPALPIAFCYYLFIFLSSYFIVYYSSLRNQLFTLLFYLALSAVLVVLFMLPAIYSYANMLPEYERYVKEVPYQTTASASVSGLVSFLFPYTTVGHSSLFSNDVSFRNFYISSIGLIASVLGIRKENKLSVPLLISGLFLFVLNLGNPVKSILYNHLPIVKNVRTNGHFRSLFLLSCCCLSGFGLERIIRGKQNIQTQGKHFVRIIIILLLSLIAVLFYLNIDRFSGFYHQLSQTLSFTGKAKSFFELINLPVALFISLFISLFLFTILLFQKRYDAKTISLFIILDLIINTMIYVPVTGVGTTTVKQIQSVYNSSPAGIPVPLFIPVSKIDSLSPQMTGLTGSLAYYNKQIGITHLTDYPSYFTNTERYFESSDTAVINHRPFLFLKNETGISEEDRTAIKVITFTPSHIIIETKIKQPGTLVYLQNNYRFWQASVNKKEQTITTSYHTFISVGVPAGNSRIELIYKDAGFEWLFVASSIAWLIALIILFIKREESQTA